MSEAAAAEVLRFALHGDVTANEALLHRIDHSLDVGCTEAIMTVAPQLLRWSLEDTAVRTSAAASLYVAVLNRHFCLRVVLDHLAQSLDRRPTGLAELQALYVTAARMTAHEAVRKQLTQCVACLLIVSEDHLAERLGTWARGGGGESSSGSSSSSSAEEEARMALHVFMAAVDLLVDRRVPLGSIRRATQRRQLQEHLSMVLYTPLGSSADMPLLLRVTDTAVRFLLEAMYGEPQEVAETFWAALPTSAVWRYSVACLSHLSTPCPEAVLDFVCHALRCLTLIDTAAETLLLESLSAVLQPVASPESVDWAAVSRVIAAALEASTEAIITEQAPDTPLFRLFSSAAERLVQVLQTPAAPSSAVCHVCEGVSALTQVLQPAPIPEMEPTDDPEDYQEIVDCMNAANATKHAALAQLRAFLLTCEMLLAARLAQSGFARAEWSAIAAYVSQRLRDRETEDFQIVHEELELALYTTYERLSRLLGALSTETLQSIAEGAAQQLLLATVSADLTLEWLQSVEPAALLQQAVLLPCTVARYLMPTTSCCNNGAAAGSSAWSAAASLSVMNVLLRAVSFYYDHGACVDTTTAGSSSDDDVMSAVLAVTEATVKAVVAVQETGVEVAQLQQSCGPLVSLLWRCVTSIEPNAATVKTRHTAVCQLSTLLERGVAALPDSAAAALATQDPYTQAALFASGGASNRSFDTVEMLAHTLNCLAQLVERAAATGNEIEEEEVEARVLGCVVVRVRRHVESADWPAEEVASLLTSWHTRCPQLALCFLKLATAVSPPLQPSLMLSGLTRFFSLPDSHDTSTAMLVALLATEFVQPIAATPSTTLAFFPVLRWLLQPHPAFTIADGGRRVRALAMCGRLLCDSGHVVLGDSVEALTLCVARWQAFVAATALSDSAASAADDDDDGGAGYGGSGESGAEDETQVERKVLEELAVWSRCLGGLAELPADAPVWLASLQCAQDDYERMEVLKNL